MAKKSKTDPAKKGTDMAESNSAGGDTSAPVEPKKKSRAKSTTKKPAAKKAPTAAPREPSRKPAAGPLREPTDDEIRLRAYFLAERRLQLSLPGDSAHDWIEARRQLIDEASR